MPTGVYQRKLKTHCKRGHELTGDNVYVRPRGDRQCKLCNSINRKSSPESDRSRMRILRLDPVFREFEREQKQKYRGTLEGCLREKLGQAKNRASRRGEYFDLTLEQLMLIWNEQAGRCALTDIEMTWGPGGRRSTSISLDRIDSNGFYTKGNVRFLCDIVNRMKLDNTDEALKEWCRRILTEGN